MSLPKFDTQGSLFESLGSIAADLFDEKDKYKLFARKVWPLLVLPRVSKRLTMGRSAEGEIKHACRLVFLRRIEAARLASVAF